MSLKEYRQKRDFTRSPEPPGDETAAAKRTRAGRCGGFFCVQKHLASHLHYDLRLEHDGVLLSWAVPKGPSIDARDKRLAMHVEDHPVEYGEFEGVIPSGYGAGIVMLWDRGTWEPQSEDVDAALRKGDLKFTLNGYKLKGSWVLVRTSGRYAGGKGDGRSWLLIKHRDAWEGPLDITTFAPHSVKSGGDFEHIMAAEDPALWTANPPGGRGATSAMLREVIERAAALRAAAVRKAAAKKGQRRKRAASKAGGPAKKKTRAPGVRRAGARKR